MKESDLIAEFLRKARKIPKTWWYKIPDPTRCPGCGLIAVATLRPFDIVGMWDGIPLALEVKRSAGIPLEPHQKAQMQLVLQAGGVGLKLEKHNFYVINPDGDPEILGQGIYALGTYMRAIELRPRE